LPLFRPGTPRAAKLDALVEDLKDTHTSDYFNVHCLREHILNTTAERRRAIKHRDYDYDKVCILVLKHINHSLHIMNHLQHMYYICTTGIYYNISFIFQPPKTKKSRSADELKQVEKTSETAKQVETPEQVETPKTMTPKHVETSRHVEIPKKTTEQVKPPKQAEKTPKRVETPKQIGISKQPEIPKEQFSETGNLYELYKSHKSQVHS